MAIEPCFLSIGSFPTQQNNSSGPPTANGGVLLNASGDKMAFVVQVPKTGTLHSFEWWTSAVANTPDNGMKLSFQNVDTATGLPDGTADQFYTMAGPFVTNIWQVPPGPLTHDGTGGGTKRSVTKGDFLCCVVEFASFVASDSITVGGAVVNTFNTDINNQLGYIADAATGTYAKTNHTPVFALKYDDSTYAAWDWWQVPWNTGAGAGFNSGSTPDEKGMRFIIPFNATLRSVVMKLEYDNPVDIVIYNNVDTVLGTVSLTSAQRPFTAVASVEVIFPSTISIAAGDVYRVTVKPTSVSNVSLYVFNINSAALLGAYPGGAQFYQTTRTDAGAWTDTNTIRPVMNLVFDGIQAGGGGGSLYSRAFQDSDTPLVDELHEKYFEGQFDRPNFEKGYLNAFVISNGKRPLIIGGIEPIAETVMVTDKDPSISRIELGRALVEAQRISRYTCLRYGIRYLHAFVKDEEYAKHLIRHGFIPRCKALSLKV